MKKTFKLWGVRFVLLLKRQLKKPTFYMLALFCVFLLYLFQNVVFPSFEGRSFGVMTEGSRAGDAVLKTLRETEGPYAFVQYRDREELEEDVLSGKLDCGFVIRSSLDDVDSLIGLNKVAEYICSPSTMRGLVLKEKVFSAILKEASRQILIAMSHDGKTFTEESEALTEELIRHYERHLSGDGTLSVYFETVETDGTTREKEIRDASFSNTSSRFLALIGILVFASAILFGSTRFQPESRRIASSMRGRGKHAWRLLQIFVPVLLITLVMTVSWLRYLAQHQMLTGGGALLQILKLLLYAVVCAVWAAVYSRLFRSEGLYLCSVPCVLLLSVICCRAILQAAAFVPVLGALRWIFPVNYL